MHTYIYIYITATQNINRTMKHIMMKTDKNKQNKQIIIYKKMCINKQNNK